MSKIEMKPFEIIDCQDANVVEVLSFKNLNEFLNWSDSRIKLIESNPFQDDIKFRKEIDILKVQAACHFEEQMKKVFEETQQQAFPKANILEIKIAPTEEIVKSHDQMVRDFQESGKRLLQENGKIEEKKEMARPSVEILYRVWDEIHACVKEEHLNCEKFRYYRRLMFATLDYLENEHIENKYYNGFRQEGE